MLAATSRLLVFVVIIQVIAVPVLNIENAGRMWDLRIIFYFPFKMWFMQFFLKQHSITD